MQNIKTFLRIFHTEHFFIEREENSSRIRKWQENNLTAKKFKKQSNRVEISERIPQPVSRTEHARRRV